MFDEYDSIMNVQEVCEALQIGKNTVYKLISKKELPSIRIGKIHKIRNKDLQIYVHKKAGLLK